MSDAGAAERGVALLNLGRPAEAERHFREALTTDPDNAELLVYLAQALHQQERFAEARDVVRQGLAADPAHLTGLIVLSASLAGLRQFEPALDAVRRGLQIAPALPSLHRQHGALLIAQDRAAEAFGPLEQARTLDPEDPDTIAMIGNALYQLRRFQDAEQAVTDALRLDPDNLEAHRLRGALQLRRGGGRSAVDAHRTALRLDPTNQYSREGLSIAMKSRNPLYGQLLRFGDWMNGLPSGARWAVLLAPLIATRILRPFNDQVWAQVALVVVAAAVVLSWALEPLMNAVLLCTSYARNLLPRATKLATYAFLTYIAAALGAVVAGLVTQSNWNFILAMGFGVWSVSAGQVHLVDESRRKVAIALQCAGGVLAIMAIVAALVAPSPADPVIAIYFLLGLAMLWFTALA